MKPRIAVTADVGGKAAAYVATVEAAGGDAVVLRPPAKGEPSADRLADLDGLLLTGGKDLDPALWGEAKHPKTCLLDPRRQAADLALLAEAEARSLPVLALCLGIQELAVHRGGAIHQHLPDVPKAAEHGGTKEHPVRHEVTIEPDSLLARLVGPELLSANSRHHQAVRDPGRGMRVVARSADGLIEAIESEEPGRFVLGVQWHAEDLVAEPRHLALFRAFCRHACRRPRSHFA